MPTLEKEFIKEVEKHKKRVIFKWLRFAIENKGMPVPEWVKSKTPHWQAIEILDDLEETGGEILDIAYESSLKGINAHAL